MCNFHKIAIFGLFWGHFHGPYHALDPSKGFHFWGLSITEVHLVNGAKYTMVSKAKSNVIGHISIKSLFLGLFLVIFWGFTLPWNQSKCFIWVKFQPVYLPVFFHVHVRGSFGFWRHLWPKNNLKIDTILQNELFSAPHMANLAKSCQISIQKDFS